MLWIVLIGVGCAVAILGAQLLRTTLLAPLPFTQAEQLVRIRESSAPNFQGFQVSLARFEAWHQQALSFSAMAQYRTLGVSLRAEEGAERVFAAKVTPDFLRVLGGPLSLGAGFLDDESAQALISERVWRTRLGADPQRLSQPLWVDGEPYRIAGVLPAGFDFPEPHIELLLLWRPSAQELAGIGGNRAHVIARLRPGVDASAALSELASLSLQFERQHPRLRPWRPELSAYSEDLLAPQRPALLLLAAVIVLLVLSLLAALAALTLLRSAAQAPDRALKSALGASAAQLNLQRVAEVLLPGLAGGAFGLVLAHLGAPVLEAQLAHYLPRVQGFRLPAQTLVIAPLLGLALALLAAAPALIWERRGARIVSLRAHRAVPMAGLRSLLIGAKFGLAFVLLSSALALITASARTAAVDPGFATIDRHYARFSLPPARHANPGSVQAFHRQLLDEVRALPGVVSASLSHSLPVLRHYQLLVDIEGGLQTDSEVSPSGNYALISDQHLQTLGLRLLRGRAIEAADRAEATPVALISAEFERRWFGEGQALGKRVRLVNDTAWREVVGVVADVHQHGAGLNTVPQLYGPLAQRAERDLFLVLHSTRDTVDLRRALDARVQALDPSLALEALRPLAEAEPLSIRLTRALGLMVTGFAALAAVIALLGLFASQRVAVLQQQSEFGLRRALGASDRALLQAVLRPALGIAAVGCLLGLALQLAVQQLGALWLQGLPLPQPLQLLAIALLLLGLSVIVALGPARSALRVPAMQVLRAQ